MDIGNVIAIASKIISLNGARKVAATSTAIMFEPWGRTLSNGNDRKLYMVFAKGDNKIVHITTEEIINKSNSLKGVLEPYSTNENYLFLKRAGFKDFMTIFKCITFEGFLAIK